MSAFENDSSVASESALAQNISRIALGGVALYLLGSLSALAADSEAGVTAAYHPVAADVQNLAQNVSLPP